MERDRGWNQRRKHKSRDEEGRQEFRRVDGHVVRAEGEERMVTSRNLNFFRLLNLVRLLPFVLLTSKHRRLQHYFHLCEKISISVINSELHKDRPGHFIQPAIPLSRF